MIQYDSNTETKSNQAVVDIRSSCAWTRLLFTLAITIRYFSQDQNTADFCFDLVSCLDFLFSLSLINVGYMMVYQAGKPPETSGMNVLRANNATVY